MLNYNGFRIITSFIDLIFENAPSIMGLTIFFKPAEMGGFVTIASKDMFFTGS